MIKNAIPEYELGKEFNGTRLIALSIDTSNKEVPVEDEEEATEGEKEETTEEEKEEKTESVPVNSKEVLTEANYEIAKNVMQKKLMEFGVTNYDLRLDKTTGTIALEVGDNDQIDEILPQLLVQGKFEVIDTDTEEVLLDNSQVIEAQTMYTNDPEDTSKIVVFLGITMNEEGKKKLEEISKTYVETTNEEGESTKKTITVKLDGETVGRTYFGYTITDGMLPIQMGGSSKNQEILQMYTEKAVQMQIAINTGVNPIVYTVTTNEYISPVIGTEILSKVVFAVMAVVGLMLLYLVLRYGTLGIISAISMVRIYCGISTCSTIY